MQEIFITILPSVYFLQYKPSSDDLYDEGSRSSSKAFFCLQVDELKVYQDDFDKFLLS